MAAPFHFTRVKSSLADSYLKAINSGQNRGLSASIRPSRVKKSHSTTLLNYLSNPRGALLICEPFEGSRLLKPGDTCSLGIYLPIETLFSQAEYTPELNTPGKLCFKLFGGFYKIQRRTTFRVPMHSAKDCDLEIPVSSDQNSFQKVDLLNMSTGGISFRMVGTEEQISLLKMKPVLKNIRIKLQNSELICNAQVKHVEKFQKNRPALGFRVGIQFMNLSDQVMTRLSKFLFREATDYFGRAPQ